MDHFYVFASQVGGWRGTTHAHTHTHMHTGKPKGNNKATKQTGDRNAKNCRAKEMGRTIPREDGPHPTRGGQQERIQLVIETPRTE